MKVAISNVHLDLGAGRRGTDMGPSAIHVAGLIPKIKKIGHTIDSIVSIGSPAYEALDIENTQSRFISPIFKTCEILHNRVYQNVVQGLFPLVLGGDHSQAIGTVAILLINPARNHEIAVSCGSQSAMSGGCA